MPMILDGWQGRGRGLFTSTLRCGDNVGAANQPVRSSRFTFFHRNSFLDPKILAQDLLQR